MGRFRIVHEFKGISLEDYALLYFDNEFNAALCSEVGLTRDVLEQNVTDTKVTRRVRVGADRELPPAAAKVLGVDRIEYTEHVDYDRSTHRGTWRTVPSVFAEKVVTNGTFEFVETSGGVQRTIEGQVKVKIFAVGGAVEKVVLGDIEKSYEKAAEFTRQWLSKNRA